MSIPTSAHPLMANPTDAMNTTPAVAANLTGACPVSIIVIPAKDERDRIHNCLAALARQTIGPEALEIIVVADACSDDTHTVAVQGAAQLGLNLTVLEGPGQGTGPARRLGMDTAAQRLHGRGLDTGLIATTDADSEPAPDWIERQIAAIATGAQVVAGRIELFSTEADTLPRDVLTRRSQDADRRLREVQSHDPEAAHHHFAGASLGLTAAAYQAVGGIDAVASLEDELFAQKLRAHGIPIARPADVVVHTTARTNGRAARGLSVDLAISVWRENCRFHASEFAALHHQDEHPAITVIIPTRRCGATIAGVLTRTVAPVRARGLVDRVIVIDAGSDDRTAEIARGAGAEVLQENDLFAEFGPVLGKGDAMWRAVASSDGDIVCFLDGDTADPVPDHLLGLIGPLLNNRQIQLVKGAFDRPMRRGAESHAHEGGRVTELTARPLLNMHFPLLAGFLQPLAGEFAARRTLLEQVRFPAGYGIEVAVLIDALQLCGLEALAESHLGTRQNDHQPLRTLSTMSFAVLAAVERRRPDSRAVTGGQYVLPWLDGASTRVPVLERPAIAKMHQRASRQA